MIVPFSDFLTIRMLTSYSKPMPPHIQYGNDGNEDSNLAHLYLQFPPRNTFLYFPQMGVKPFLLDKLGTTEYDYGSYPDPRLFVCALQPFVDEVQMTIDGEKGTRKVAQVEFGKWWEMDPSTGNDPQNFYGWPVRKYNFLEGHLLNESKNVAGYNIYFIRLLDIYLMYAELLRDEGNEALALEYVNKVHRRAYGYDPDSPSLVDYSSLSDRTKTADPEDHLANDPLLYERWAEMFGEMRWWEDVRRLRIGKQEAEYYKTVSGPGAAKTNLVWNDKTYAMPIPAREFESNPSPGMVQTPGYN